MNTPLETSGFSPVSAVSRAELLDHAKHPRNRGELADANVVQEEVNPLCGDVVKIYAKFKASENREQGTEGDSVSVQLSALSFTGNGCLISQAAASLLTEHVVGKSTEDILRMERADVERLLGSTLSPSRVKCAMLALIALKKALQGDSVQAFERASVKE
ncbi:MAG: nitrogen fixation protein NifU [Parcubacteria group bacterium Gr01-1014_106]|nr:MAG: nitrogen fixation protein NifU [Parcubacteria group bacterium Gr01-1014_106]